jgi:excisionase family DNA binding protein
LEITMTNSIKPPLASVSEVAVYLNVSEITVRRMIKKGKLPATKIGGQLRIRWDHVNALVAHGTIPSVA